MKDEGAQAKHKLTASLAREAGVDEDAVMKVLTPLGLDTLIDHIGEKGGVEALRTVEVGHLKLAAKLAQGSLVT